VKPRAPLLTLILVAILAGDAPAQEASGGLRAILNGAEVVVRGVVLDQEPAPGGLWHRFQVEEVIWPPPGAPGLEEIGPTLRLFAHGEGVPEGAELAISERLIVGASWLPAASTGGRPPFLVRLEQSFRPDRPGERPALAAPDGLLAGSGDPAGIAETTRLVRTLRDPGNDPRTRRETLLQMAVHPVAAFREEALRQLARPEAGLDPACQGRLLAALSAEIEGPASPPVLAAHLELIEAARPAGAGPLLAALLRSATAERVARRAGLALARVGTPEDLEALARELPSAEPWLAGRIVMTLSAAGSIGRSPPSGSAGAAAEAGGLDRLLKSARTRLAGDRTGAGSPR
jgi:hypothetical protein